MGGGNFARAKPIREADHAVATLLKRGRPTVPSSKARIGLRLSSDLIRDVRATGRGYNSRIERLLRVALIEGKL
jgi:uncharacterized protein (DUF4415 family)